MSLKSQLRNAILTQSLPPPSDTLLTSLTTARNPPPPLPSLLATARARLLACDLTSSSSSSSSSQPSSSPSVVDSSALAALPTPPSSSNSRNGEAEYLSIPELKLTTDVYVQVLDVENLSLSRWEQIEELEAVVRGETTRGREVIRVTADDDDQVHEDGSTQASTRTQRQRSGPSSNGNNNNNPGVSTAQAGKNATHRLTVQDRTGRRLHALELRRIDGIGVNKTSIGEKILLKGGTVIARGTILLTPDNCVLLGGKIEAWHKAWVEGRLARLKEAVEA